MFTRDLYPHPHPRPLPATFRHTRFDGMTFPSDRLISDYQANAGITLTGVCLITPTKTHISNVFSRNGQQL